VAAYDEALARGVASIRLDDGTFVDEPVAARARAVLAEAARSPR
jgi:citrate lyase subunit beta/citryl-CoA lyase